MTKASAKSKPSRPIGDIGLPRGECVLKHLQAFLAYALNAPGQTTPAYTLPAPSRSCRALSQALVAWVEKCEGYAYHEMYVIGCLVRAEDAVVSAGGPEDRLKCIREIRIGLESGGGNLRSDASAHQPRRLVRHRTSRGSPARMPGGVRLRAP